jgi:sarcosine oxidase subunit gamma
LTPDAAAPLAERRSVLEKRALPDNGGVKTSALPFAARWILRGGADVAGPAGAAFGVAPPSRPLRAASEGPRAALWMGPDEWLLIAEDADPRLGAELEAALAGVPHSLVDVSHRQVAIEVAGPGAARLLNAGVPLDLDLAAFPLSMVLRTLLLKAEIVLWRREAERFRLEVARSFGPYVAAVLAQSAGDQEGS